MGWISVEQKLPEPYVSVLGYMTDAEPFPAVRECYVVSSGRFYFPALNAFHPISHWLSMSEGAND